MSRKQEKAMFANNTPSPIYESYLKKFPNSHIAQDVERWGIGTGSHGHFGDALRRGDIEEAMFRADAENLVKLKKLGIDSMLSDRRKHPDDPSPKETFDGRYNWAKDYVKLTDKEKIAQ